MDGLSVKAVIYARVSKDDGSQTVENQLLPLREFAKALKVEVVKEYVDQASGGNGDRKAFQEMLSASDRREFELILVWALDRLTREGISNMLGYLQRFKRAGVAVKSLQESWCDTSMDGVGELLITIFAWTASQERKRLVSRIKAGLERRKGEGKTLGRPKGAKDDSNKPRARAGYLQRYAGATPEQRKLWRRYQKKETINA